MNAETLDVLIRGASIGILAVLALLARRVEPRLPRPLILGLTLSGSCFAMAGSALAPEWSHHTRAGLRLFSIHRAYFFWGSSRYLFEDRFEPRAWHLGLGMAMIAGPLLALLAGDRLPFPWSRLFASITVTGALALMGHLIWRVVRDRRDDHIRSRRRMQLGLMGAGAAPPVVAIVVMSSAAGPLQPAVRVLPGLGLLLLELELALVARLVRLELPTSGVAAAARADEKAAAPPPATGNDSPQLRQNSSAMEQDELWRATGLTIGTLAEKLGLPEYRLRRLINQDLGHRNFTDFLNGWRLREAIRRLRDPAQRSLPVLTIALDAGYGSIGPFNRAFKATVGCTPTEYRRGDGNHAPAVAEN